MEGRRAMVQIHCLEVEFGSHATAWKDFREKVRLWRRCCAAPACTDRQRCALANSATAARQQRMRRARRHGPSVSARG
jgi:hypothetical protein